MAHDYACWTNRNWNQSTYSHERSTATTKSVNPIGVQRLDDWIKRTGLTAERLQVRLEADGVTRDQFAAILADMEHSVPKIKLDWLDLYSASVSKHILRHTFKSLLALAFSGGQRQRLALALALAHQPKIMLLDEATSSL